jgi:hypothetical protein
MRRLIVILEEDEIITADLYIRPLMFLDNDMGDRLYQTKNAYSGRPINNFKWTEVLNVLGDFWLGKTIEEFNQSNSFESPKYEFAYGKIPKSHILDLKEIEE